MIKRITRDDLSECLEIYHKGYETVAIVTEENEIKISIITKEEVSL